MTEIVSIHDVIQNNIHEATRALNLPIISMLRFIREPSLNDILFSEEIT